MSQNGEHHNNRHCLEPQLILGAYAAGVTKCMVRHHTSTGAFQTLFDLVAMMADVTIHLQFKIAGASGLTSRSKPLLPSPKQRCTSGLSVLLHLQGRARLRVSRHTYACPRQTTALCTPPTRSPPPTATQMNLLNDPRLSVTPTPLSATNYH
ncbi:unnamed protein product [Ectocarpus sp. 12 AP-2014]